MKAAVLRGSRLSVEEAARPQAGPGQLLLRVRACGVCRTDLHIVDGELPALRDHVIPGHQIVGEVVESGQPDIPVGMRVGVSWLGGTDGTCPYCRRGLENLCTGFHRVHSGRRICRIRGRPRGFRISTARNAG